MSVATLTPNAVHETAKPTPAKVPDTAVNHTSRAQLERLYSRGSPAPSGDMNADFTRQKYETLYGKREPVQINTPDKSTRKEFKPQFTDRASGNKSLLSRLTLTDGFPGMSVYANYYNEMRTAGYVFAAIFPKLVAEVGQTLTKDNVRGLVDDSIADFSSEKINQQVREIRIQLQTGLISLLENNSFTKDWWQKNYSEAGLQAKYNKNSQEFKDSTSFESFTEKSVEKNARRHVLKTEAAVFGSLAIYHFVKEINAIKDNCKLALGAELGKDKEKVNWIDLFQSDNPLIHTEANRVLWKFVARGGSAMAFATGMMNGLIASAFEIGAERTVFYKKTAYDDMVRMVNDVQLNHLNGDISREAVVNDLQRIFQSVQVNHQRMPILEDDMHALKPTLENVAQDIIDKRIGIESLVGIIGGGIIVLGDPEQSAANYDHVRKRGFEGISRDAQIMREGRKPGMDLWDTSFYRDDYRETNKSLLANEKNHSNRAESAQLPKLLEQRQQLEQNASHFGISSRSL